MYEKSVLAVFSKFLIGKTKFSDNHEHESYSFEDMILANYVGLWGS